MAGKRFRTRQLWSNTAVWALAALMLVLASIALMGMTGEVKIFYVAAVIAVAGSVVSFLLDRKESYVYSVEGDQLVLRGKSSTEKVALELIKDASLVDRRAARDLLRERLQELGGQGATKVELAGHQRGFLRWCTVDIGLRSFTFGVGRELIDRRPDAKHDLVLLRLRDGRLLLLSPVYNQDLVETLYRMAHRVPGEPQST